MWAIYFLAVIGVIASVWVVITFLLPLISALRSSYRIMIAEQRYYNKSRKISFELWKLNLGDCLNNSFDWRLIGPWIIPRIPSKKITRRYYYIKTEGVFGERKSWKG